MKKNEAPLFSIIVPIYNVEEYISQCLDSVLRQPYCDYELILVDDGSRDGCALICDAYAEKDGRIAVIHKENGGLSDARNAGILAAAGKYLLFIDGDDFIAENSLRHIADALRNDGFPDVLFMSAQMYYGDGSTKPYGYTLQREHFYGKNHDEVLQRLASGGQFHISACVKAVKRQFLLDNGVFFPPGVVGEDVDYSIQLYLIEATYSCCEATYYCYRQGRAGSIMARQGDKRFVDLLRIIEKWTELSEGIYKEQRHWIMRFLFHQYYTLVLLYQTISPELKTKQTGRAVNRFSYLLRYAGKRKAPLLLAMYRVCGLGLTSRLLNILEARS